jgi:hypothetical protein
MGPPEFPQKGPTIFAPAKKNKIFGLSESSSKEKKKEKEKTKKKRERVPSTYPI